MENKLYIGYIEKETDYIIGTMREIKKYKNKVLDVQLLEDIIINDIIEFLKIEIYNTKMKNKDLKIICDTHWKEIRGYINKDLYFNINLNEEYFSLLKYDLNKEELMYAERRLNYLKSHGKLELKPFI